MTDSAVGSFIQRWSDSSGSERATKDQFLLEFCDLLGVERPRPATGNPGRDLYVFEKDVLTPHAGRATSIGKIDFYKHGHFLLEAKQGSVRGSKKLGTARRGTPAWNIAMRDAFGQALGYAQWLDEPPPFLITCDIGHCFDVYATFDGTTAYRPFPNPARHRIYLADLADHLEFFKTVFTAPHSLDPALEAAKVSRDVAARLAKLAASLEESGHDGEQVAKFLMRCIFTMFAEDVGLLPDHIFTKNLHDFWIKSPKAFPQAVEALWRAMNEGSWYVVGRLLHFNGGLFRSPTGLPLTKEQLELLLEAAECRWAEVEPAIFGTLLERALRPDERHKLGAHFTPPVYVQRLVREVIEEPLRADWSAVQAEVRRHVEANRLNPAKTAVREFHARLCTTRVLDPACGTGNFLYVALEFFKRLEAEVLTMLVDLDKGHQTTLAMGDDEVSPAQFFGIEVKPWAKEIAELVLWIGYLQWHFRARKDQRPREPVLRDYQNVKLRDAVLAWERKVQSLDQAGKPRTRWDGHSKIISATTGQLVPDEDVRVPIDAYTGARAAAPWPDAEFIVGNPPFLGKLFFLDELGEGYVDALRTAYRGAVPDGCDFVMYWWHRAAEVLRTSKVLRRFGFITTKSITQTFNRRVVAAALRSDATARIAFAIPNHPWIDSADGAAVRIAMTVMDREDGPGILMSVVDETPGEDGIPQLAFSRAQGVIHSNLKVGADVTSVRALKANLPLATMGPMLGARGFLLTGAARAALVKADGAALAKRIPPLLSGKDLVRRPRGVYVIDLHGFTEADAVKKAFPACYQHLRETVYKVRKTNKDKKLRDNWWLFRRTNEVWRSIIKGLPRFIATTETAEQRVFTFVPAGTIAEHGTISIGTDDAYVLGVLSSRFHTAWALVAGGRLGVGDTPRYNKTKCFDPFPMPAADDLQKDQIRDLAEELDAHRKRQLGKHDKLTYTDMYNALDKLRSGDPLTEKERAIHEQSLGTVLSEIHDRLDAAVAEAYGWSTDLEDEDIVAKVVELNAERRQAEEAGVIRWIRPKFQETAFIQLGLPAVAEVDEDDEAEGVELRAWPGAMKDQVTAVRAVLGRTIAWSSTQIASAFDGASAEDIESVLESLAVLGLAVALEERGGTLWKGGDRLASVRPPPPSVQTTKAG